MPARRTTSATTFAPSSVAESGARPPMNFPIGVRTALKMTGRSMMIAPSDFRGRKYKYKRGAKRGQFRRRPSSCRVSAPGTADGLRKIQLPGNAVAVVHPGEHSAESVFADRHCCVASRYECRIQPANFVFRAALDEQ